MLTFKKVFSGFQQVKKVVLLSVRAKLSMRSLSPIFIRAALMKMGYSDLIETLAFTDSKMGEHFLVE